MLSSCKPLQNFLLRSRQKLERGYCTGKLISEETGVSVLTSYHPQLRFCQLWEQLHLKSAPWSLLQKALSLGLDIPAPCMSVRKCIPIHTSAACLQLFFFFFFCFSLFPVLFLFSVLFPPKYFHQIKLCCWGCSGLAVRLLAFKWTCCLSRVMFPLVCIRFSEFSDLV